MMAGKTQKTDFFSYKSGQLAKGCELCVQGRKSVLFITGICQNGCYYCPISDAKKNKDVIYINEVPVEQDNLANTEEMIEKIAQEIRLCSSMGIGITGGDPLARIGRTTDVICGLKKRFGQEFHIHLYTPLVLVDEKKLSVLSSAGLDEIRFHPDVAEKKLWPRLKLAKKHSWDIGIEIPAIPGKEKETKELIDYAGPHIKFLNLNELELADNSFSKLSEMGFKPKDSQSYAAAGSMELAMELLIYCENKDLNIHLCTAKLKDAVQMAKRIRLRARNVALPTDRITADGMLVRGAAYLSWLVPGKGYRQRIKDEKTREKALAELDAMAEKLKARISGIVVDEDKLRLLTSKKTAEAMKNRIKDAGGVPAIVEEYPTYDGFEVEIDFI
ncbi:radical SAM protein [Candidatus Woesearchaeota archaeon]|nr:radical SAM protein [Candidatus Woesearchaeota archaeon]